MGLPFDDWSEADGPQNIESIAWFEAEASGPGKINRLASVTGILVTQIADSLNMDDGTITLDTGYALNPNSDQWTGLIDGQNGPLVSCYVVLSSIGGTDPSSGADRNGWLESVSANFQSVGNQLELFLTIKAGLIGDIAFMRIGYQVVLLFNSNRPPAMLLRAIIIGGIVGVLAGQAVGAKAFRPGHVSGSGSKILGGSRKQELKPPSTVRGEAKRKRPDKR